MPDISFCRSCGAQIYWLPTTTGSRMPANAHTVGPDDERFDVNQHQSHVTTCPHAGSHRTRQSMFGKKGSYTKEPTNDEG